MRDFIKAEKRERYIDGNSLTNINAIGTAVDLFTNIGITWWDEYSDFHHFL